MLDISRLQTLFEPIFPGLIGLELIEANEQHVLAQLKAKRALCTGRDTLHWGVMVGMAQTMGTVAAVLNLPEGHATRTVHTETDFLADPPCGSVVQARCEIEKNEPDAFICVTTIHDGAALTYARVTQRQIVVDA